MASDVLALMDALHIPKAALVGFSDGAIIGLELATNHPGLPNIASTDRAGCTIWALWLKTKIAKTISRNIVGYDARAILEYVYAIL